MAIAGDSIILDAGPYGSTLRPGQTVQLNHIVLHYQDRRMTGSFLARYATGDSVGGKVDVTRQALPLHPTNGKIVTIEPYKYPDPNALTPQQTADRDHYYPNPAAYQKAAAALDSSKNEMQTITYLSDGLKVKAYLYKPRETGGERNAFRWSFSPEETCSAGTSDLRMRRTSSECRPTASSSWHHNTDRARGARATTRWGAPMSTTS